MVKGFPVHIFSWPTLMSIYFTYFIQPQSYVNKVFYSHTSSKKPLFIIEAERWTVILFGSPKMIS